MARVVTPDLLLHRAGKHDEAVKLHAYQSGPRVQFVRALSEQDSSLSHRRPRCNLLERYSPVHRCRVVNADQEVQRRADSEVQRSGLRFQTTADADNSVS
jgi:hypothetical protein